MLSFGGDRRSLLTTRTSHVYSDLAVTVSVLLYPTNTLHNLQQRGEGKKKKKRSFFLFLYWHSHLGVTFFLEALDFSSSQTVLKHQALRV